MAEAAALYAELSTVLETATMQCKEKQAALPHHPLPWHMVPKKTDDEKSSKNPSANAPQSRDDYYTVQITKAVHDAQLRRHPLRVQLWEAQAATMHWPALGNMLIELIQAAWPQLSGDAYQRSDEERYMSEVINGQLADTTARYFIISDKCLRQKTAQKSLSDLILYAADQITTGRSIVS